MEESQDNGELVETEERLCDKCMEPNRAFYMVECEQRTGDVYLLCELCGERQQRIDRGHKRRREEDRPPLKRRRESL